MDDFEREKRLHECKVSLYSCLLAEPDGIPVGKICRVYEDQVKERLPFKDYGFSSAELFVIEMMLDVATVCLNKAGDHVFKAHVDDTTAYRHVASELESEKVQPNVDTQADAVGAEPRQRLPIVAKPQLKVKVDESRPAMKRRGVKGHLPVPFSPEATCDDEYGRPYLIDGDVLMPQAAEPEILHSQESRVPALQGHGGDGDSCRAIEILRKWLLKTMRGNAAGLHISQLHQQFEEDFNIELSDDLKNELLEKHFSDMVVVDGFGTNSVINLKQKPVPSDGSVDSIHPTSQTTTRGSIEKDAVPDQLELPLEPTFLVCVEHAESSKDVVIRIIGSDYSEKLDAMEKRLEQLKRHTQLEEREKSVVCIAAITKLSSDGGISPGLCRVRIREIIDDNVAEVELLDRHGVETVPVKLLFQMPAFCQALPYQTIECCLSGVESFNAARESWICSALNSHVLGKTMQATVDERKPKLCLTLTDMKTGLNLNEFLSSITALEPQIPELGESRECEVSFISDTGAFYVHFNDPGFNRLLQLERTFTDDVFENGRHKASLVEVGSLYAVRASSSGNWSRALVIHKELQQVTVKFVDYGDMETVSVEDVRNLPTFELSCLPYQAVRCWLVNSRPRGVQWTADVTDKAWSILSSSGPLPTTSVEVLSAATDGKPLIVTVVVDRTRVLLNELACYLTLDDWLSSVTETQSQLVSWKSGEDIRVTCAEDPSNFKVLPVKFLCDLRILEAAMEGHFSEKERLKKNMIVHSPSFSEIYAARFDNVWRRVKVVKVLPENVSVNSVLCKLIDYGNISVVKTGDLRQLEQLYCQLPMMASSVQLANLRPRNKTWSELAKQVFSAMVVGKRFAAYDASDIASEPADGDHTRSICLVGMRDGRYFHVDSTLLQQGLGVRL